MSLKLGFKGSTKKRLDDITTMVNLLLQQMFNGKVTDNENINNITFVTLAKQGYIDDVTAGEHTELFSEWKSGNSYAAGDLNVYLGNLYRCLQAHTAQDDWTPPETPALWKNVADPTEEYPKWSQPIGATDCYSIGDKVTHSNKRWESTCDGNVWEPGVYGWTEIV